MVEADLSERSTQDAGWVCVVQTETGLKMSPEPRKKPSYFPLYWMVNRDPYNGLL